MLDFGILPPPAALEDHVECFRLSTFSRDETISLKVCPTGHPEIVFQHRGGQSAVEDIVLESGRVVRPPLLFVHGQVTEVAVMSFRGPFATIQAVLKPFALQSLFGVDARGLAKGSTALEALMPKTPSAHGLERALLDSPNDEERVKLLEAFLEEAARAGHERDALIEEGINLIEREIANVTVKLVLEHLGLSERQFERRFLTSVGISPLFYIRVRRVNEAFRLMDSKRYERLSDVAYALNFYDQSHFIREVKTFSGVSPKSISQKVNDFHNDVVASSYVYK